jgi:hypothetical protein
VCRAWVCVCVGGGAFVWGGGEGWRSVGQTQVLQCSMVFRNSYLRKVPDAAPPLAQDCLKLLGGERHWR